MTAVLIHPNKYDVLCGKDKACSSHYGSRHFRSVIEAYRNRYQKANTKQEKMNITKEIVMALKNRSRSRFLKYNTQLQGWEEISHIAARDKVSHALRFANRRNSTKADEGCHSPSGSFSSSSVTNMPMTSQSLINNENDNTIFEQQTERENRHARKVSNDELPTIDFEETIYDFNSNNRISFTDSEYCTPEEDLYEPIPLSSVNNGLQQSELYEPIPLCSIKSSGHGAMEDLHWVIDSSLLKGFIAE